MKNNVAIYVLVGNKDFRVMQESIFLLKKFHSDLNICVYHDLEINKDILPKNIIYYKFDRIKYPIREENRNSSLFRLIALLNNSNNFENLVYIDNDIYVVHHGFFEGFEIAKNYGLSLVQNPRRFQTTFENNIGDAEIGEDVSDYDKKIIGESPKYITAFNMGIMFYNKKSYNFIDKVMHEQKTNPSRGQAALYRTMWKEKFFPCCLPTNWLVCGEDCGIKMPLSLHVGHKNIKEWYEKSFKGKI